VSAALDQCVTAGSQGERSATFSGEMTAVPGGPRMAMKIEVEVRLPEEAQFHTISAPGLGVWRNSDPGVKTYRYVKQVTNLSVPATYRASVHFRWMNAKGHTVRRAERHTRVCDQPASAATPTSPAGSTSSSPAAA
jgi:hypothetical protein